MGNSNSSGGGHHHHQRRYNGHHMGYDKGWTHHHSLENPEPRNRMKRGYYPPRAYVTSTGNTPTPQKVLPQAVNPTKILKATSNGAILHGGGTISGRKLSEIELDIRKRSTASCPAPAEDKISSGRSTPNLLRPKMGVNGGSSSSGRSRNYGSEPDLRDIGNCEQVLDLHDDDCPLPNSFTLISESPAKKQIRSRKKSKAPAPPVQEQILIGGPPSPFHYPPQQQYLLQQNQQRQLLLTPVSVDDGSKKKSRLFKTKAEAKTPNSAPRSPANSELMLPSTRLHPNRASLDANKMLLANKRPHLLLKTPDRASSHEPEEKHLSGKSSAQSKTGSMEEKNRKKFYFGMDSGAGTFSRAKLEEKNAANQQQHKEISRKKMLQKLENGGKNEKEHEISRDSSFDEVSRPKLNFPEGKHVGKTEILDTKNLMVRNFARGSDFEPDKRMNPHKELATVLSSNEKANSSNLVKKIENDRRKMLNGEIVVNGKKSNFSNEVLPKVQQQVQQRNLKKNIETPESDSDGIHRRQDSGNFEIKQAAEKRLKESSSDLSSSEVELPQIVRRPVLPQKRPELPRFSPTAAWRAIDSPSSHKSYDDSSEEFKHPIHRYTRPSAPMRLSHERSGDSGISAGDAGSPANQLPIDDEEIIRSKIRSRKTALSADRMMKCWTPEQDLDESSSEFEQDNDPVLPPVPPKPLKGKLFQGKRASAVVSDSDSKYFRGEDQRRFHGRSAKGKLDGIQHQKQSRLSQRTGGFVGLDTNWYLSRSEPNSLNYVGLSSPVEIRQEEIQCHLQLGDEDSDELVANSDPAEIGYGPSNMRNFRGRKKVESSSYEDQEERINIRESETEEELMRDDLFDYLDQYEEGEFEREQELSGDQAAEVTATCSSSTAKNNSREGATVKPFSHNIMYLPSYDCRKGYNAYGRRARSVDHLDSSESQLFRRPLAADKPAARKISVPSYFQETVQVHHQTSSNGKMEKKSSVADTRGESSNSSSTTKTSMQQQSPNKISSDSAQDQEQERRAQNKKKFKFQSTLRVLERKKMEEQLSREAQEKEEARLREIEEMKKVEEEFQKKRASKEKEIEEQQQQLVPKFPLPPKISAASQQRQVGEKCHKPSKVLLNISNKPQHQSKGSVNIQVNGKSQLSQRQEPEGAPASVSVNSSASSELRRELILASKKRQGGHLLKNANHNVNYNVGGQQELTEELSEYHQERRQYCDYRRPPRQHSLSPARYPGGRSSSSSDIFPMSRGRSRGRLGAAGSNLSSTSKTSTVHPQVVCDIPAKGSGAFLHASSRLSGSQNGMDGGGKANPAVVGSLNNLSGFGERLWSDNYRRDWARQRATHEGGGRASSVISLHSDNLRNSTSDLSRVHSQSNFSPLFYRHKKRSNQVVRQYSTSPPPSASPVPQSSNESTTATESNLASEKSSVRTSCGRARSHTTVISIGPPTAAVLHAKPFNRVINYRPVPFKPAAPAAAVN